MIETLESLLLASQAALWAGFVVLIRVGAMLATLPLFGERMIPVRIRLGLAIAFCLIVTPALAPGIGPVPQDILTALPLLGPEVIAGLFLGLLLRFFVICLQIAGSIAAQSTSLSQIFGGSAGVDPLPAMGHVLVVGGLALAAIMDLHVAVARYVLLSYQLIPLGILVEPGVVADLGTALVAQIFALAFCLAAPFLIGSLIYNVTLGVINRAMPQLLVSFVGAPAITAGGLLLLFLTAPLMLSVWIEAVSAFLADPGAAR